MLGNFYRNYPRLRITAIILGIIFLIAYAHGYVLDIEFHGPGREVHEKQCSEQRGKELSEKESRGEKLTEKELKEAHQYNNDHMS